MHAARLVARDSLGLVVHSRRRRRRAELPVAVGVGLAELALHRACAWLTSAARFVSARVGATEGRPGRVKSGHLEVMTNLPAQGRVLGGDYHN